VVVTPSSITASLVACSLWRGASRETNTTERKYSFAEALDAEMLTR